MLDCAFGCFLHSQSLTYKEKDIKKQGIVQHSPRFKYIGDMTTKKQVDKRTISMSLSFRW